MQSIQNWNSEFRSRNSERRIWESEVRIKIGGCISGSDCLVEMSNLLEAHGFSILNSGFFSKVFFKFIDF